MYYSMTGYGSSSVRLSNKTITVEIKSLNSKGLDMNLRLPSAFKSYELEIRSAATDIAEENAIPTPDLLSVAMRIPNIMENNDEVITEEEWVSAKRCVSEAILKLAGFRKDEGAKLKTDILSRIKLIANYAKEVEAADITRMQKMKDRLKEQVADVSGSASFNADRFEQEIIYYLEKMDITEELVRLKTHCDYFSEISNDAALEKGKKLGFVAQEIGREINTIGSKASDAPMQKIVVMMKDELEKIKEQLNNVL
jgi:uncharacterized protein (TIGR00255 family)